MHKTKAPITWRCRCGGQSSRLNRSVDDAVRQLREHQRDFDCRGTMPRRADLLRSAGTSHSSWIVESMPSV